MTDPIQTVREALSDHTLRSLVAVQRHAAAVNALDRVEAVVKAARALQRGGAGLKPQLTLLYQALAALDPTADLREDA